MRALMMKWVCTFGIVLLVLAALIGLTSCAAAPKEIVAQVCYLRIMGQTEEGNVVVLQACQSPEDYQESQQ